MIRLLTILITILSIIGWSSCSSQQATQGASNVLGGNQLSDSLFMSFERTPCFGKCPAFRFNLYRSGFATYEGTQFSEFMGMHHGQLNTDSCSAILSEADRIGFFGFEENYDAQVTDLPSMIIELRTNEKQHRTRARVGTPKALKEFGKYLDSVVAGIKWTPIGTQE